MFMFMFIHEINAFACRVVLRFQMLGNSLAVRNQFWPWAATNSSFHLRGGLPAGLRNVQGLHSKIRFVHRSSSIRATVCAHLHFRLTHCFLISGSFNICSIHVTDLLSSSVIPSILRIIFLWVTTSFWISLCLRAKVSVPYIIAGSIQLVKTFLLIEFSMLRCVKSL